MTMFDKIEIQLFEIGTPQAIKSIIEKAQIHRKIDSKNENQIKAVREIFYTIAVDQPIIVLIRLIYTFNAVVNCKTVNNERINVYVSIFQGLASEHQMRAGTMNNDQIGEFPAINLLKTLTYLVKIPIKPKCTS